MGREHGVSASEAGFLELFPCAHPVLAMIHIAALPGTPRSALAPPAILERALEEASIYQRAGVDGLLIENMHDVPYLKGSVGPEITAAMAVVAFEIKRRTGLPCGVQILAGANMEALAVARAAALDFIRVEGYLFAHVADEGFIEASAGALLRYRRQIQATDVFVLCDIKKKHSAHAITADVSLTETAQAVEFFQGDGVIVTGSATGQGVDLEELARVKAACKLPVLVGSGASVEDVESLLGHSDALIVGSHFKAQSHWAGPVEHARVARFMERVRAGRERR